MLKHLRFILKSNTGSAILPVALAAAALGGAAVMMMRSNDESNKAMKSNFITEDMQDMSSQMQRLLSSSGACTQTFGGKNARSSVDLTEVKDHTGIPVLSTSTMFGTGNLSFESIKLEDPNSPLDDVNVVTGGTGSTYAVVKYKKMQKTKYENQNKVVKIRLQVVTDASDVVTNCFSLNASDTLWAREVPSDKINYVPGKVGIGLKAPTEQLDVSGAAYVPPRPLAVAASTTDGKKISVGGTATQYQFNLNEDLPLVFKERSGTALGKLMVNNAVADQSIILTPVTSAPSTPTGVPCTPSLEGAMRMREIFIRAQAHSQAGLTLVRTQICSDYGGQWKWRTLKLQRYTRASGASCTPGLAQKDCTDHNSNSPHQ